MNPARHLFLGATSERVLRKRHGPVLVINRPADVTISPGIGDRRFLQALRLLPLESNAMPTAIQSIRSAAPRHPNVRFFSKAFRHVS
jgi:hypothetical protein